MIPHINLCLRQFFKVATSSSSSSVVMFIHDTHSRKWFAFCFLFVLFNNICNGEKREIKILNEENFNEELAFGPWLVLFCEKGVTKCEEGESVLNQLSDEPFPYVAHLAYFDCSQSEEFCLDLAVTPKRYPSFLFKVDPNERSLIHSSPSILNATEIYQKAYFKVHGSIIQLFDEHFEGNVPRELPKTKDTSSLKWRIRNSASNKLPFFVVFYNTWCMHSKVFLQGVWNQIANRLQKEANVAKVDCTDQAVLCQRQGVTNTPTVILYYKGKSFTFDRSKNFAVFLKEWSFDNLLDFYTQKMKSLSSASQLDDDDII